MAILKDLAQVLRIHEQGNTSLVVVMLGRTLGQFRIHAKGARRWPKKGFEGGFDLLARGEILLYPRRGDALWLYKEWDEHARPAVGQSAQMLHSASYLCELTDSLTRHTAGSIEENTAVENAALYDLLAASAEALAQGAQRGSLMLIFTLSALRIEGLLPDLESCAVCSGNTGKLAGRGNVWLFGQGVLCSNCFNAQKNRPDLARVRGVLLSAEAHRSLIFMQREMKPVKVTPAAARQLARAQTVLVHGALEHDLRTLHWSAEMKR